MIKYLNSFWGITLFLCLSIAILICSCFGERGLLNMYSLKKELHEIEDYNERLQVENEALREYIYLLKNDTRYIEKIAREELGLIREGEIVCFFESD